MKEVKNAPPGAPAKVVQLPTKLYGTPAKPSAYIARVMKAHPGLTWQAAVEMSKACGR